MNDDYLEYLNSPKWQELREQVLKRDDHRCRICNSPDSLVVHHRTYERVGREPIEDLTTLCKPCHDLVTAAGEVRKPPMGEFVRLRPLQPSRPSISDERRFGLELLSLLISFPALGPLLAGRSLDGLAEDPTHGLINRAIQMQAESDVVDQSVLLDALGADDQGRLQLLLDSLTDVPDTFNETRALRETLTRIEEMAMDHKLRSLDAKIRTATDKEVKRSLVRDLLELQARKQKLIRELTESWI